MTRVRRPDIEHSILRRAAGRRTLLGLAAAAAVQPVVSAASSRSPGATRPMLLETTNTTSDETAIVARLNGATLALVNGDGKGIALQARLGPTGPEDVRDGGAAILGANNAAATAKHQPTGVLGRARGPASRGVMGETDSGIGVYGRASSDRVSSIARGVAGYGPIGVSASTLPGGTALLVEGRLAFTQAGTIEIAAGKTIAGVSGPEVGPSSFMLAVAQEGSPVAVRSVERLEGAFRVHLASPAPAGGVRVGYLVLG